MRKFLVVANCALMLPVLAACHQAGPAEKAGRSLDNAGKSVSDPLNPPQGRAQATGRKVDRALGN